MFERPSNPARSISRDAMSNPQEEDQEGTFVVGIVRDIWRLRATVDRIRRQGEVVPDALLAIVERLQEDLEAAQIELIDPIGQPHDPGARYEVAFIDPSGNGPLQVSETLSPGVRIGGKVVAAPTVVLAPGGKA